MKETFAVLGMLIEGCGFEDIAFQSGISTTGSLNGVIAGTHYNRCWKIHQHFAEALERLLFKRFCNENGVTNVRGILGENSVDDFAIGAMESVIENQSFQDLQERYGQYKDKIRSGLLGKTCQFWLVNYLDVMEVLHLIHSAVQGNDYALKLEGWIRMMPYFFALNKTNYSRYGSYYIQQLISLDRTHPGCKELIEIKGVSVQAKDQYPLRTAIDQRGEQTLNREAKSVGGIGRFGGNIDSIIK